MAATDRLEGLIDNTIDSAMGYEKAAGTARSPELKAILSEQAAKRRALVDSLNSELVRLGGQARTSGSFTGGAHRAWLDLASVFERGDEAAAERVEEGEDYLEEKFRDALDEDDFDHATRAVLERAHLEIAEGERLTDKLADRYD